MMMRIATIIWVLSAAAFGVWVALMASDHEHPVDYLGAETGSYVAPNQGKMGEPVDAGGHVFMHWNLTPVKRDCPRYVQRFFYDRDTGKLISSGDRFGPERFLPQDATELNRTFVLPRVMPQHASFKFQVCFECNPYQKLFPICYFSPELSFDVIDSADK
jgi:hypothetical protein